MYDCLIVGAGISGLMAARILHSHGIKVMVLDKGRGIGGRMATRRFSYPDCGEGIFDYGAPYFTMSSPEFQKIVQEWQDQGIVKPWLTRKGKTYYCGVQSNRAIAKHLALDLRVHTGTRVSQIQRQGKLWQIYTDAGEIFSSHTLLLTPPVPQTLELLQNSSFPLSESIALRLTKITYKPCLALLGLLCEPVSLPASGGLVVEDSPIAWLGCNQKKGISSEAVAVTIHATADYSRQNWHRDDSFIFTELAAAASNWLNSPILDYQIHRWRYSQPQTTLGEPFFPLGESSLVLAGDGLLPGGVEGAALSGIAAGKYLSSLCAS